MNKKILLTLVLAIFLMTIASAETFNNVSILAVDTSYSVKTGVNFTVDDSNVGNITIRKFTSGDANTAYLYFANGTTLIQSASFSGLNATINYTFTQGQSYIAVVDKGGSAYSYGKGTAAQGFGGFPKAESNFTFVNSIYDMSAYNPTIALSIEGIWAWPGTTPSVISVNLTSPANDTLQSTSSFLLNATETSSVYDLVNATYYVWDDNGTLVNTTKLDISGLSNSTSLNWTAPYYSTFLWNVNACVGLGEAGNCSMSATNKTLSYSKILVNSQTYNTTTIEGAIETFEINLTLASGFRISTGYLVYNGTQYSASITLNGLNNYLLRSITIPQVSTTTNLSFYWSINLDDASQTNTTALNQTVYTLSIDDCSVFTYPLFNFTMYDEDTQSVLDGSTDNTSVKVTFNLVALNNISNSLLNYSKYFNYTNPSRVCLQNSLGSTKYRLDGVIEYSSLGRFQEYYHFQNYTLDSTTANVNISLYNLNSSNGQEFKVTYKDSNFVPVSGAILQIQRKYIDEGVYKTTEIPKTGTEGYTIAHLVRNDVIYNIIVLKNGAVLATFEEIVADCQNPTLQSCEINLNSYGTSTMPSDFSESNDITFTLIYNASTREISSVYAILSGITSTVSLNVTLYDTLGNTSVCNDILYSSGGQLSCTVPSSFGNATVIATLYKDGTIVGQSIIKLKQNPQDIYGGNIILIAMLLFLVIAGVGASSDNPMFMAITLIMGSILLVSLNLVYTPSFVGVGATILWFIIAIVIVMIKGANRQ